MKYILKLSILAITALALLSATASAHRPDRCFHTHFGGNTNCKKGIAKKKCTDAKGNKGRCTQSGSHCYCKLFPKKKKSDASAQDILDLGLAVGGALLEKEHRRKHRKHRRNHREDRHEEYDEE